MQMLALFFSTCATAEHVGAGSIPTVGIPVMNNIQLLDRLVASIDVAIDNLFIVHNFDIGQPNSEVCAWTGRLERSPPHLVKKVSVVTYGENVGCAGSWNTIMLHNQKSPWWLIVNSDIAFTPGVLSTISSHVWNSLKERQSGASTTCAW